MSLKCLLPLLFVLFFLLGFAPKAHGQECSPPSVCVPKDDMEVFVALLKEKKCLKDTKPEFKLDPVKLFLDKDGRVFYNGSMPHPYKLKGTWCNYTIEAEGHLNVVAAMQEPPIWGFRFRPKAYIGFLLAEPFYAVLPGQPKPGISDLLDAGFMVDFFHYDFFNLNAAVGFQSVGGGVGFDLTKNFGAYVGYGLKWGSWHHNPNAGIYFGF